jgi:hypothetical protein
LKGTSENRLLLRANIRLLVNKFKRTGSVHDEKRSGRPQTSEDDTGRTQQAIYQGRHASIRRISNQLDIPRTTVWRILHFELKKRAYHLQTHDFLNNNFLEHMDRQSCTETLGATLPRLYAIRLLCLRLH